MRITHEGEGGTRSPARVELIIWTMAFTTFAYVTLSVSLSPLLTAISEEFGVSESAVGQLATVGGFVSTISALVSAPWMGRYARRTWLRAELGLLLVAVLLSALAPNFPVMVLGRILIGIAAGALVANCFTAASEVVTELGKQGRAVGIVASGTTVAVLAGLPAIAFLEDQVGWRLALGSLSVPLGLSLAGTMLLPAGRRATSGDGPDEAIDRGLARRLLRDDRVTLAIVLATGSIFVAYIGWITYYSAYVERDFTGGAGRIGVLFIVGGLAELAGNFGAPALSHRAPVRRVALLGMAGMAAALLGSGALFGSMGGLFVGIALLHLCTSFAYVGLNTLLVHRPAKIRGTVMALSSAAVGLGGALGALIGGAVLAMTDDYLPVFHVLGALLGVGAIGLALVFRSAGNSGIVDRGAPLWSE
ncbi:MAG TPA: MFS transporter [Thermomicrobiales bacterium]|nr:MFS transporter [Thermomicrobiales bacterium]